MTDEELKQMRDDAVTRGQPGTAGVLDAALSLRELMRCAAVLANYTVPQPPRNS